MNRSGSDANESVTQRPSGPLRRIQLQHYALAILSVGVALGASLVLEHFHFHVPSALLLLFAVAISSWYGGPGPAALAVLFSAITFYWYFVQPVRTPYIYWSEIPYFIIFTALAALVSWFGTVRRRVEADLRQSRDVLREQASLPSPALRLALIYAFFGALWILVSDRLSFYLVPDLQLAERVQTYKGWFFIAVTSVLLWLLAKRFLSQVRAAEEALRRLNRELQAISNCNQSLLRATDEQSLLEEICRIVCEEAGYRMAFVAYGEHDEAKSVRPVAWSGAEEGYLATVGFTWADTELGRGPTGTAIRSGKTCCTEDLATDPRIAPWRESVLQHDFRSSIALPLKDEHDRAFGSLTIYSAQPNASTPEEVRLLEELAGDLAFGIVTLRSGAARKRAEEALHESETRFRTFVDHAGDALFVQDLGQGTIVDVNREACESLGYTRQELIGKTAVAFHLDSDRAEMESAAERAATGETVFDTHWHRRKDGSTFPVEVHTSLVSYGGRRFLLKVARDITDRLRAEKVRLEERVRERTRIARELHDTLLQSFQGTLLHFHAASSLLPTRTAEAKKMLDSAIDMAAQAITEGRDAIQELRSPEVEINDLAVAIRTFGESLADDRGDDGSPVFHVELVGVASELDPTFAREVYRIAIEALRNSFQHAEARHIKVEIHHEEKEFRVLVRDDGKGIDSKSLDAEGCKGHYGLRGMRERAKLIGSEIVIRSEVGAGTEVELRVPAVAAYAACGPHLSHTFKTLKSASGDSESRVGNPTSIHLDV